MFSGSTLRKPQLSYPATREFDDISVPMQMQKDNIASADSPLARFDSILTLDTSEYAHAPLQQNEIRLLRGHVDEHGALIGEIQCFPIDSPELPSFQAVSYTWGVPLYTESIDIGAKKLPVLASLYPLLRYLLENDAKSPQKWYWIDSLCISQKNDDEKAAQVPMMGQIFRTAQQTFVWLGEEAEDSTRAIEFLHWIVDVFSEHGMPSEKWLAEVTPRDGAYGKDWEAVEKLFARPWWTRVWTVQEYIVARKLRIHCGASSISRSVLRQSLQAMWQCRDKTLRYDNPWNRSRLLEWYRRFGGDEDTRSLGLSLTATMAYLGYHHATDPRDRIYSLSGIVKDFDLAGVPDYNQPVELLYSKLVMSFVNKYQSLDIICFATLFRDEDAIANQNIPSWVPDWRVRATAMVGPLMVSQSTRGWIGNLRPLHSLMCTATYLASLNLEPRVVFSQDMKMLICQGFVLDTIDGLTGLPVVRSYNFPRPSDDLVNATSNHFASPARTPLSRREISSIMTSLVRCLTLDRGDHYFNHYVSVPEASQALRLLVSMALNSNPRLRFLFRAWFKANRSFLIRGLDLETLATNWLEGRGADREHSPDDTDYLSFYSRLHDTIVKMSRRLVVTNRGILGMAPRTARKGDVICVLYGCSVPVVLRKAERGDTYTFIGECYADGYMNGEALTLGEDAYDVHFKVP